IIKIRFENTYLQTYYSPPTVKCSTTHKGIINTNDNTPIFENHFDDFFEYSIKKIQVDEDNTLYEDRFSNLSAMARDFLAIPSTSIASKQMFSCADHIIDDDHTSLDHNTVAVLMCQQNWLEMATKFG
ncbi:2331_t:CDS:2, partial [Cetraspora pellucida]